MSFSECQPDKLHEKLPIKISFCKDKRLFSLHFSSLKYDCDALRDLTPFAQFRKRENTQSGVLHLLPLVKVARLHGCLSRFLIVRMVPNRTKHHNGAVE